MRTTSPSAESVRHSIAERTLARRGQHLEGVEHLGGLREAPETGEPGPGEHDRVELAGGDLADAGVHVAAHVHDLDPEAEGRELGRSSRGAGADARPGRQLTEGEAVAGHHHVAGVLPSRDGGERDAVGGSGRAGP